MCYINGEKFLIGENVFFFALYYCLYLRQFLHRSRCAIIITLLLLYSIFERQNCKLILCKLIKSLLTISYCFFSRQKKSVKVIYRVLEHFIQERCMFSTTFSFWLITFIKALKCLKDTNFLFFCVAYKKTWFIYSFLQVVFECLVSLSFLFKECVKGSL